MGQAAGRLQQAVDRLFDSEGAAGVDDLPQVAALDVFHDEEVHALGFIGVVGDNDVLVRQRRGHLHFPPEPLHLVRRIEQVR